MIIVYSTRSLGNRQLKNFSNLIASKLKGKGKDKPVNTALRLKAKAQLRRKDGKFAKPLPNPESATGNPMVSFYYPMSSEPWNSKLRVLRVISANGKYLTGLERVGGGWQYKKFLAAKAKEMQITSFNPQAMS